MTFVYVDYSYEGTSSQDKILKNNVPFGMLSSPHDNMMYIFLLPKNQTKYVLRYKADTGHQLLLKVVIRQYQTSFETQASLMISYNCAICLYI